MIGRIPEGTPSNLRNKMTISQAFLVEYLGRTISPVSERSIYPPILRYYYVQEENRTKVIMFILKYFQAVSKIKSVEWENPDSSIICNAMGIGALVKVMQFIFVKMFVIEFSQNPNKIDEISVGSLAQKLTGLEKIDFSKAKFAGGSSAGASNQLMREIVTNLNYFNSSNYDNFISEYRHNYLPLFIEWLKVNTIAK
jgi:hypothetical protein